MSHIFISYRRADSAGHTGRLYDDLSDHFGQSCLFIDIDMKPGVDFAEDITKAVASCDVLLAVIGRQWLTSTDAARRRLADPGDYVRLEIAAALSRKIPVILVQGAVMPAHIEPGQIANVRIKLTPRGRRIVRTSTRTTLRGRLQIQNPGGTLDTQVRITLRR